MSAEAPLRPGWLRALALERERLVLLAPLNSAGQSGGTSTATFQTAQSTLESLARSIVSAGMNDRATTDTGTLP